MTDASTPDDEIISSYLDGEATPSQVARIRSDPSWMQRASELRAAATLAAGPVTALDPDVVDRMIATAIDAGQVPDNVTDLSAARRSRLPQVLTVAAAIVMLALAVPIVRSIGDSSGNSDSAATSFDASSASDTAAAEVDENLAQAESALAPKSVSPTTTAATSIAADSAPAAVIADGADLSTSPGLPPANQAEFDPLPDRLPDFADIESLRRELSTRYGSAPIPPSESSSGASPSEISPQCADLLADFASNNTILSSTSAPESFTDFALVSVNGTTDLVALIQLEPGRAVALLVDASACEGVRLVEVAP